MDEKNTLPEVIDTFYSVWQVTKRTHEFNRMDYALGEAHYWLTKYYNDTYCENFRRYDTFDEHRRLVQGPGLKEAGSK